MSRLSSTRTKIQSKIFDALGSTAVRTPFVSATYDKWGDKTDTTGTNENITVVPYNYLVKNEDYQPFGELVDGETMMAVTYDQTINQKDTITYDSKTFIVKEIEHFPLDGGNVLQVLRLAEEI